MSFKIVKASSDAENEDDIEDEEEISDNFEDVISGLHQLDWVYCFFFVVVVVRIN